MAFNYYLIIRILGFIIGVLLVYYSYRLFKALNNKEFALSMVFSHKELAANLFLVLVFAAISIFITGVLFVITSSSVVVDVFLDVNALIFLIFAYSMYKLMNGAW